MRAGMAKIVRPVARKVKLTAVCDTCLVRAVVRQDACCVELSPEKKTFH